MARFRITSAIILAALVGAAISPACAQAPFPSSPSVGLSASAAPPPCAPTCAPSELLLTPNAGGSPDSAVRLANETTGISDAQPNVWVGPNTSVDSPPSTGNWFVGADFLYVRPHFSEATAFVEGTQSASSFHATAQDLDFQYSPSFRVFAGYRIEGTDSELKLTYTRLTDQTQTDAGNFPAGHFAVDPFGNVVGTAVVINPASAQFGQPIVGGDHIQANASVTANVFDIDLVKPLMAVCGGWELKYTAGVRIADISQLYQSTVTSSGAFFSGGEYAAEFIGAGPRIGFQAQRYFGACRQFSLYAHTYGSLLVGAYDENFAQTTTSPAYQATQATNEVRVLPVAEAEVGAGWSPLPWFNISAGWLFQAWFDLGGSGGTFGGFYTVTENSNIMAFEGLFVHADLTF